MGQHIKTDGTVAEVHPANGKKFTLKELQEFVGGYIELVTTREPRRHMYVNEEGTLDGLPLNQKASELIHPMYCTVVVGDVLVCEKGED